MVAKFHFVKEIFIETIDFFVFSLFIDFSLFFHLKNDMCFNKQVFFTSITLFYQNMNKKEYLSIIKELSIVILSFSIVFYWLSADISIVFRIFAITFTKIAQISSNFDSVYDMMISI